MNAGRRVPVLACLIGALAPWPWTQSQQEFRLDPAASSLLIQVGRAGLFAFAGHNHEVAAPGLSGTVILDVTDVTRSRVTLEVDAAAMRVTGRGEPAADVPEVQRVMLSERVLDVERHPAIAFESRRISLVGRAAGGLRLRIDGDLTLRGTTRPVSVPVDVQLAADRLTAAGKIRLRQTDFGIRPVTAAAGTVRVKDEVEVEFTMVARRHVP